MIVADANTLAYVWFPSNHREAIFKLLHFDQKWAAPLLWKSEFRSIAMAYLRKKYYTPQQITDIVTKAEAMMQGNSHEIKSISVLQLAQESGCTAYDCEYVSLAYDLNVRLITYDKQLLREFPTVALTAEDYLMQAET